MEDNGILGEMQGAFRRKDGRRTTFLLYKGYVHLKNQKWVRHHILEIHWEFHQYHKPFLTLDFQTQI
jgi:hypothetical protein